jgi:DUF1680 family protein
MRIPGVLAFILLASVAALADPASAPQPVKPTVDFFNLADVRLLDSPFKAAQDTDHAYLLKLEPDRLLAWFRREAGLQPKAPVYAGWESLGVAGHTCGHYLSALSQMYAATGDPELKRRADYIVSELAVCQQANGGGYLCAFPNSKELWGRLKSGNIDGWAKDTWAPWYTIHKEMAGLIDTYTYCHNAQALEVAKGLADWTGDEISGLNHDQLQQMLLSEQGGIAESLANLYGITHEPKYLDLAEKFRHDKFFIPFSQGQDNLTGNHANTQIPKFVGYQRVYELTGDDAWNRAALNFWTSVTRNRSWVIGGNSEHEFFFAPDQFEAQMTDVVGPESCNSYNMIKLTEHIFQYHPQGAVMDYYEKTLYNHILSTIRPRQDGFVYYTSMSPGSYRNYSSDFDSFWCCTDTGMENHTKYGKAIYAHEGADKLLINLFIPSTLTWKDAGLTVTQTGKFPVQPSSQLALKLDAPKKFTISVRQPGWLAPVKVLSDGSTPQTNLPAGAGELQLAVNGKAMKPGEAHAGYVDITRTWHDGDILTIGTPMALHVQMLPHSTDYAAVLYGPIVLAGKLGLGGLTLADFTIANAGGVDPNKCLPPTQSPVMAIANPADIPAHLQRVDENSLTFMSHDLIKPRDLPFVPFYQLYNERYTVYWKLTDPAKWQQQQLATAEMEKADRELTARTLDAVRPQEPQPEVDHHLAGDKTNSGRFVDTGWRDAGDGGWFSYTLATAKTPGPLALVCKYWGSETGARTFDVQVDGTTIATENVSGKNTGAFFNVTYPIPAPLTEGKDTVTVKFQAHPGNTAGGLFHIALVKAAPGA